MSVIKQQITKTLLRQIKKHPFQYMHHEVHFANYTTRSHLILMRTIPVFNGLIN